ncbi:MAG: hypothetical protein LBH14_00880 [Desulfobulbaceae bacterium]|nr:hypothetical protein [Desulfobulbaceae bacterium]
MKNWRLLAMPCSAAIVTVIELLAGATPGRTAPYIDSGQAINVPGDHASP